MSELKRSRKTLQKSIDRLVNEYIGEGPPLDLDIGAKVLAFLDGKGSFVTYRAADHATAQRAMNVIEASVAAGSAVPDADTIKELYTLSYRAGVKFALDAEAKNYCPF